ncbi:Protein saf4 [Vermiconidia calcicola]|uniref:Protein saf4 n=1 Tax=Vermiconidia calcicola TaxID=1690605 RepID=A0ACC3NBS2_9PEZI|nr:Protein saf4 [Vermiconidia calcicola]
MQGFNMGRYVPPDLEATTSANTIHKKKAPGTLRKDGSQTVRFEMPFAVWCHTCQPHAIIGQGVRFNAEKKKVGYYYSTPIWQFRLKHTACGGTVEMKTDPKNTQYVVTEGGKARDYGDEEDRIREGEGGVPILTAEERERRKEDAFAQLEGKVEEKRAVKDNTKRIEEIYRDRERNWEDTWSVNRRMRETFRRESKVRAREEEKTDELQKKIGTAIEMLPETSEDVRRAGLISFGDADVDERRTDGAEAKALFRPPNATKPAAAKVKPSKANRAEVLRRQLLDNTRATMNPFGTGGN